MSLRDHWRAGRSYGYPRCCIARFVMDKAVGRSPNLERPSNYRFVPCDIFHKAAPYPRRRWCLHVGLWAEFIPLAIALPGGAGSLKVCRRCGKAHWRQRGRIDVDVLRATYREAGTADQKKRETNSQSVAALPSDAERDAVAIYAAEQERGDCYDDECPAGGPHTLARDGSDECEECGAPRPKRAEQVECELYGEKALLPKVVADYIAALRAQVNRLIEEKESATPDAEEGT